MYRNMKYGFDAGKIMIWFLAAFVLVAALCIAAEMTAYTRVTDQAIVVCSPFSRIANICNQRHNVNCQRRRHEGSKRCVRERTLSRRLL